PAGTYWYSPEHDTYLVHDAHWDTGLLDSEGDFIVEPRFFSVYWAIDAIPWQGPYFENRSTADLFMVRDEHSGFGLMTFEGEEIIPAVFEEIGVVSENGMVPVCSAGKYGYIDINS
ncbi:MAG: WG repeat-containing protein, partial [Clostridiales bacterium]|nr:WG repeat-containing protein [Clostridiales bacterium]